MTKLVYAVAQDGRSGHVLAGLQLSDGHVSVSMKVPSPDHQPYYDQQRGALALTDGYVYVVFGGHYGDCGPYRGTVVGMPASGHGPVWHYVVPTAQQGGIWASGGPVVGPNGTIYISTGNGAASSRRYDGSDSVTALTPALKAIGIFAPTDWRTLSADDVDLGSMSPALLSDGQILQVGKSAVGYLLNSAHLGGIGGQLAAARRSAWRLRRPGGQPRHGVRALRHRSGGCRYRWRPPRVLWRGPATCGDPPCSAAAPSGSPSPSTGVLYELAPGTGRGARSRSASPRSCRISCRRRLSGGLVLVGTMTGVTAVSGG